MAFKTLFETPEAEVARLAEAPVGSTSHALSLLPVNIRGNVQDLMIELPSFSDDQKRTVVVVPMESHRYSSQPDDARPRRRYNSSWTCIVVASDHPSYPVQGYRISVPEHQLVRGTLRTLAPAAEEPLTIQSAIDTGLLAVREPVAATEVAE